MRIARTRYVLSATILLLAALMTSPSFSIDQETQDILDSYEKRIDKLEKKLKKYRHKAAKLARRLDDSQERLRVDGFLSAGLAKTDEKDFGYLYGTGLISDEASFVADSIMAIQMEFLVSDNISVTTQLWGFAQDGLDNRVDNWDVRMEWANIAWQVRDDLTLRAGRLRLPLFALSEYVDVGYAYPWVRPPQEVYEITITSYEGFDFIYDFQIAQWSLMVQGFTGKGVETRSFTPLDAQDAFGISITASNGPWSGRYSYTTTLLRFGQESDLIKQAAILDGTIAQINDASSTGIAATIRDAANAAGIMIPNPLIVPILPTTGSSLDFIDAALSYDSGRYFVMSEATLMEYSDSAVPDRLAYYLTLGMRYQKFTPFVHLAYAKTPNDIKFEPLRELANEFSTSTTGNAGTNAIVSSTLNLLYDSLHSLINRDQRTYALGLRYELSRSVALKLQSEVTGKFGDASGNFIYTGSDTVAQRPHSIHTHSFVIDAIF